MSLWGRQHRSLFGISGAQDLIPPRPTVNIGTAQVNNDTAMRHSAVWACLRLRADLISTLPVDVYRRVGGHQVEMPTPPILVNPGGERVDWCEWMYSSQVDLDRAGNVFGLITELNSAGLPNRIDLQPLAEVTVIAKYDAMRTDITYRIGGKTYPANQVWHEKQFTVAGFPLGLSPVAYAAWTIGEYLSIQQFATDWFSAGATPIGHLKNVARELPTQVIDAAKDKYKAAVKNRDLFVSGKDWEYTPMGAVNVGSEWIEDKKLSAVDIARFFGCPATEIEAAIAGSSVTYANLSQDDLRFLIKHLGPAITRREKKISQWWLPQPRYIKFNTDALLRMDPKGRAEWYTAMIGTRAMTPDEAREKENLEPLTEAQYAQFERLFPPKHPVSDAQAIGDNPPPGTPITPAPTPPGAAPAPPIAKKAAPLRVEALVGHAIPGTGAADDGTA